jgi:hypothetical protein
VHDDVYEGNDALSSAKDLGQRTTTFELKGLVMAETDWGAADWFRFVLPAVDGEPQTYPLTVSLEFKPQYGDLDLGLLVLWSGSVVARRWEESGTSINVAGLASDRSYEVYRPSQ